MSILIKNTYYKDISPVLTGKETPAPYKTECSISTINDFWKALDGDDETYFRSNISTTVPFTLKIDFGTDNAKKIAGYILNCLYNVQYTMNSWTFEGSNDGNNWDVLDTRSDITWDTNTKQQFTFSNLVAYRYYRFNVSKKNGTNSVAINTVQFLEEEETKFEFRKVKKDNLPSQKSDGADTLYFTEKGTMYITDKDGNLIQCGGDPNGVPSISSEDKNAVQSKDDGLYVRDLSDEVNKIRIAQLTVNSELEHCEMKLNNDYTPVLNEYLPFEIVSGNMTSKTTNLVNLKAGKTYLITTSIGYAGASTSASILYDLMNITTNESIQSFQPFGANTQFEYPYTISFEYTPTDDCEIGWKTSSIWQNDTIVKIFTICTIHEIGRAITIDPVEYVNNESGIEDTPIGTIIPYMGTTSPKHYLICDGAKYNISDYPNLAQHFIDNFGSVNFFGGDGTITFAVPDLRGEFLRGTGTADRNTGSGADIGVHQDATLFPSICQNVGYNTYIVSQDSESSPALIKNPDVSKIRTGYRTASLGNYNSAGGQGSYTSRPTNTSVNYCIKYEPTYFMKNIYNADNIYSKDEIVIGKWIDGKPLYRKVIETATPSIEDETEIIVSLDINYEIIKIDGTFYNLDTKARGNINFMLGNMYLSTWSGNNNDPYNVYSRTKGYTSMPCTLILEYIKTTDSTS